METFKRICPKCGEELSHKTERYRDLAEKQNVCCKSCAMTGRVLSDEWKTNMRNSIVGQKRSEETRRRMREAKVGKKPKPFTVEHKKNIRLAVIKRIEKRHGTLFPNYNPEGCKIIDEYGDKNGYNFQHAENGGEKCIDGYWPDGIDEKRNTIIEIDEKHHFDVNGNLKQRDIERQQYLENLGYKIIRITV